MNKIVINELIAKACGWREENLPFERHGTTVDGSGRAWWHPDKAGCHLMPPDYCGDLNAMHEAEQTLSTEAPSKEEKAPRTIYRENLCIECLGAGGPITSTAMQRAIAFLKTIGQYKK